MASTIVSETIDADYPVAGVDNDTQGFRDNFSIIKTGLSTASSEITQLQANTAKLDEANDFNGTQIADAELAAITGKTFSSAFNSDTVSPEITYANGLYQTFTVTFNDNVSGGSAVINLSGWPERDGYSKMTVEFAGTGAADDSSVLHELSFAVTGGTIKYSSNWPSTFQIDSVTNRAEGGDPIIVEFWTKNQGGTIYANYLGVFA